MLFSYIRSPIATSVSWTKDDGWIKLNVLQTSFIRVNYDVQNWIRLTEHLMTSLDTTVSCKAGVVYLRFFDA